LGQFCHSRQLGHPIHRTFRLAGLFWTLVAADSALTPLSPPSSAS
jgi:hypothetical protein